MTNPSNKKVFYPIPSLCECGCNGITWNGKRYIHGHNSHKWTKEKIILEYTKYYSPLKRITKFDIPNSLLGAIRTYFGTYNKFCDELGLQTYHTNENIYLYDEKPSIYLGYIVGVCLGDANISTRCLNLTVTDKDFIDYFAYCLETIGFKPSIQYDAYKKTGKQRNQHRCAVYSSKFCSFLKSIRNTNWCKSQDKNIQLYILKGLWDSEGSIKSKNKTISFANTNKDIVELYSDILFNVVGIPSNVYTGVSRLGTYEIVCYHVTFSKKIYRKQFMNIVGVTIDRKREKLENII